MTLNRRQLLTASAAAAAMMSRVLTAHAGQTEPVLGDNGLHIQDWFLESFLDLPEDLAGAAKENKSLIILFEQRGCPYCRELHRVNFADEKIRSYMKKHFQTIQLDIWGSREVTDFDGKVMGERKLASRWRVNFTPAAVFFDKDPAAAKGKIGRDAEVARMPGYFKPFHFYSMLEYVAGGHYHEEEFQRFLQNKIADLAAKGIKPNVW